MKAVLLILILLSSSSTSMAAPVRCDRALETVRLISRERGAERWQSLLDGPLSERFRDNGEVRSLTEALDIQGSRETPNQAISFQWEGLSGQILRQETGDRVQFSIPIIALRAVNDARPRGLNLEFAKLIVALTKTMRADAERSPHLHEVEVLAEMVVNQDLVDVLKASGFRPTDGHQTPGPSDRAHNWGVTHPDFGRDWMLILEVER